MKKQIWLSILAINYVYSSDPTPTSAAAARFSDEVVLTYNAVFNICNLVKQIDKKIHAPSPSSKALDSKFMRGRS